MSNITEIKWRAGARFKTDPYKVHEVLERVRKKGGGNLDPELVVEVASKPRSPIHKEFEWDDATAAHEHRVERARNMIRCIHVIREEAPEVEARAYEVRRLPAEEGEAAAKPRNVYQTTEDILADPLARDRLLARAMGELAAFRERYAGLSELAVVFAALDDVTRAA